MAGSSSSYDIDWDEVVDELRHQGQRIMELHFQLYTTCAGTPMDSATLETRFAEQRGLIDQLFQRISEMENAQQIKTMLMQQLFDRLAELESRVPAPCTLR